MSEIIVNHLTNFLSNKNIPKVKHILNFVNSKIKDDNEEIYNFINIFLILCSNINVEEEIALNLFLYIIELELVHTNFELFIIASKFKDDNNLSLSYLTKIFKDITLSKLVEYLITTENPLSHYHFNNFKVLYSNESINNMVFKYPENNFLLSIVDNNEFAEKPPWIINNDEVYEKLFDPELWKHYNGMDLLMQDSVEKIKFLCETMYEYYEDSDDLQSFLENDPDPVFGPKNRMEDCTECPTSIRGGCRMLTCQCYESDDWFDGRCHDCFKVIRKKCYAIRIPVKLGGWRECYCSFEHMLNHLNEDDDVEKVKFFKRTMENKQIFER